MSYERTQRVMDRYFSADHGDLEMLSADVVFTLMATSEQYRGRDGVAQMLHGLYQVAFQAHAELRRMLVGERGAACEFDFVGTHTGEFARVPPTGKQVRVPFAVFYDVDGDQIVGARIYMEMPVMLAQLGAAMGD